jgi:hypothetical protein
MKNLKTYEGFFGNLFGGKKPLEDPNTDQIIIDTLIDLQDSGFDIKVFRNDEHGGEIIVAIKLFPKFLFDLSEITDVLKFSIPYLQKEIGLKFFDLCFRESKWTHTKSFGGSTQGTHKLIRYTSLRQINGDERTAEVKITFK